MNVLRFALLGCLFTGLIGCGSPTTTPVKAGGAGGTTTAPTPAPTTKPAAVAPAEKTTKEKLLGTWEITKSESGGPVGATVEFTKDGQMKMTMKGPDGKPQTMEAKYKVEGDKVIAIMPGPGGKEKEDPATITKLTESELAVKDKDGKTDEYKRK